MIRDYFSLALENLKHRGIRSWLTMLGIFIGIAAVVSLISLGSGLQAAITGQFSTLSVDLLTIQNAQTSFGPPGSTVVEKLNDHDIKVISEVSGIKEVVPRLIRVVSVEYNDMRKYSYLASMPQESDQMRLVYDSIKVEEEIGRTLSSNDNGKVVLGSGYSDDRFGKDVRVGSKLNINGKSFEVVGILKPSSTFVINEAILMLEDDMKNLLNTGDEIDVLIVQVDDKDKIADVAEEIKRKLRSDRNLKEGEDDFSVQTPLQSLQGVNTILNIINFIVIGIAALSLVVGGIGIMNTMYTSVLERTKEIGVMKAIGAQNKDILFIFLIESGLLGLVGGIVGAVIGILMAIGISNLAGKALGGIEFEVTVSYLLLISAVSFSFLIGIASGIFPARQASKLKPVEALRK